MESTRALDIVSEADGYYFPVVDSDGRMVGIFSLSDVRRIFRHNGTVRCLVNVLSRTR